MPFRGIGSRLLVVLIMGFPTGCGEGIKLIQESENSGVVRYLYRDYRGHLLASRRAKALEEAGKFCGSPIQIVREGPTRGRKRVVDGIGGPEVLEEKWWGIRFHCQ